MIYHHVRNKMMMPNTTLIMTKDTKCQRIVVVFLKNIYNRDKVLHLFGDKYA
jgi:hypothetical protein